MGSVRPYVREKNVNPGIRSCFLNPLGLWRRHLVGGSILSRALCTYVFGEKYVNLNMHNLCKKGANCKHWCMDMKLGGWGQLLMPNILKVTSRSSGVIQGQMRSNGVNISVWT